jgi:hypothetical protein
MMPQIKVEILIPFFNNDGSPIENEKVSQTYDELVDRFGRCSSDNSTIDGRWKDPETKVYYNDKNRMMWVIWLSVKTITQIESSLHHLNPR